MTESLFSCYHTCGLEETFQVTSFDPNSKICIDDSPKMQQRASLSRQADHRHGSVSIGRVRSEERLLSGEEDQLLHDQSQDHREELELKENSTMDDDEDNIITKQDGDADSPDGAAPAKAERIHRRAMSDPFDTPISDNAMDDLRKLEELAVKEHEEEVEAASAVLAAQPETPGSQHSHHSHSKPAYPTLPRYPVAATRDKNCWSEPPISIFSIRGANYLKDKKKVPSKDYLFRARGCDLFLFDESINVFERYVVTVFLVHELLVGQCNSQCLFITGILKYYYRSTQILQGQLRSLPTLSINFQFPWGCILLYFEIPEKLSKYVSTGKVPLDSDLTVAERVVAKWMLGDTNYKNERLKLISYVAEGPWVVRNMVTGRPAIIGKKLPVSYSTYSADPAANLAPLLQCTLDIGSSSATAKRIVSVCRRYMSALTVDIGFVIQGDTVDELPEQMLAASRIHGPDPLKAPKL